jgi:tetratricopeptide (TPR) repeat protein
LDELTAYDLRLRGNRLLELSGAENLKQARDCFIRALKLEPDSAPAYAGLSMTYGYECDLLLTENYGESLARHIEYAERAVALDEADSRSHYAMVCALLMDGHYEKADSHAVRALELNPSEYHNLCSRGYTLMSLGRNEDSLACFNQSLRRNPLAPNSCLMALGLIEYLEEHYGQSSNILARITASPIQKASTLAAASAQAGNDAAAQEAVSDFARLSREVPFRPSGSNSGDWRYFWELAYPYLKGDSFDHLLDGIAKAKLPM